MKRLPVTWRYNHSSWMNATIFTNWLQDFDDLVGKQKRKVLLFLDNAPVHPPDVDLKNITLKFFPPNTTSKIQPLDQGIIKIFKGFYKKQLVQHIIANADLVNSIEAISISALDAIWWIDMAWRLISETTIQNVFRTAGFITPATDFNVSTVTNTNEGGEIDYSCLAELNKALKHVTVDGQIMSAADFVVGFPKLLRVFHKNLYLFFHKF